ncbi:MAG: type II secretion system protein [Lachnospiraceae bacterium]|nr:type II secretion system protein [Lachnospiraceae bacterium]
MKIMKKMNNKGFSLIELIIVIAIMAVLVAIIAPNLTKYLGKSKDQTDKSNLDEIKKQTKNAISDASTDDVNVVTNDNGTSKTAKFKILGNGTTVTVTADSSTDADTAFAAYLKKAYDDDLKTVSKKNTQLKSVTVTIVGCASDGFTVDAAFTS